MRKVRLWPLWLIVLIAYAAMLLLIVYVNSGGPH